MQNTISNQIEDFGKEETAENPTRIPIHGSMTRPANPQEGFAEMKNGRLPWGKCGLTVTVSTDEFTSSCPTTGQPDFNQITIEYTPDEFYLESKTIKFYLWSFREHGAHCETLADTICQDILNAINPKFVRVTVNQSPRGGLRIVSKSEWRRPVDMADLFINQFSGLPNFGPGGGLVGIPTPEKTEAIKHALAKDDLPKT